MFDPTFSIYSAVTYAKNQKKSRLRFVLQKFISGHFLFKNPSTTFFPIWVKLAKFRQMDKQEEGIYAEGIS